MIILIPANDCSRYGFCNSNCAVSITYIYIFLFSHHNESMQLMRRVVLSLSLPAHLLPLIPRRISIHNDNQCNHAVIGKDGEKTRESWWSIELCVLNNMDVWNVHNSLRWHWFQQMQAIKIQNRRLNVQPSKWNYIGLIHNWIRWDSTKRKASKDCVQMGRCEKEDVNCGWES